MLSDTAKDLGLLLTCTKYTYHLLTKSIEINKQNNYTAFNSLLDMILYVIHKITNPSK